MINYRAKITDFMINTDIPKIYTVFKYFHYLEFHFKFRRNIV